MRLAAMAIVVGLGSTIALAATSLAAEPSTVTCESIIDPDGSSSWRPKRVVLGVVAVPSAYIPQTVATGEERWRFWSKAGLVVRADSPVVVVSVPTLWRGRAAIAWGNEGPTSALRFETCPPASSLGDWNPYAGGFFLHSRAACVPLTFRVGGRSATVRFGVGKRCG